MTTLFSLLGTVGIDPSGVGKGLGQADTKIGAFANKLNRSGATLTKGLTLPIVALGGFALKSAMDVDEAYDTIQAGTGATGHKLKSLQNTFDAVAKKTPADLNSVADTVTNLNKRLDLTGPTLGKLSRQVLEAGRLGGVPIDIKNATAAFSVFDVQGKQTTAGMDDLFSISQNTGVGINDLTAILAKSGGVLTQLGFSFTESASLIGTLDKAGINSRAVVSSMSAGLVKLAKDGEAPSVTFDRVTGRIQDFIDKGKDAKSLDLAAKVFGSRGAGQFVAALKSGKVNLDDISKAADGSGGSILGVANKTKDFPELWQQFKNQATLALAPIAADLMPKISSGLRSLSEHLRDASQWWNGLSSETQGYILKALAIAAALGPVLMVTAKMITIFQTLAPIIKGLQLAWMLLNAAFIASPIGATIAVIALLVGGLILAYQHSETFRNIVNAAFAAVSDFVTSAIDFIVGFVKDHFTLLVTVVTGPLGLLVLTVVKHWDQIKGFVSDAIDWVIDKVKAWGPYMLGALLGPLGLIVVAVVKHWDQIKAGTSAAWDAVTSFVSAIPGKLLSFFMRWTLAGQIIQHWDDAKDGTIRVATSIVTWVAELPGRILGSIASLGGSLRDTFASAFSAAREAVETKVGSLLDYVRGIPDKITNAFKGAKSLLSDIGGHIVQGLVDGISAAAHKVLEAAEALVDQIPGPIRKIMGISSPSKVMLAIGRWIVAGLVKGLNDTGSLAGALDKINDLLTKAIDKQVKGDKAAAAATKKVIAGLRDERAALEANDRAHTKMVARLTDARDKLQDLVKTARDYAAAVSDSIVATGNITGFADEEGYVTSGGIVGGLAEKLAQAYEFVEGMEKLSELNLNETSIEQLKEAGVEGGLATVRALLAGGKAAVASVNRITAELVAVGGNLGDSLSEKMYGSGIRSAQSLVDGLEKQVAALEREGRRLAQALTDAMQDELDAVNVRVRLPHLNPNDVYTSAHRSTTNAGAAAKSTAPADRTDELIDALDRVADAADGTTVAVKAQPRAAQTLERKGLGG